MTPAAPVIWPVLLVVAVAFLLLSAKTTQLYQNYMAYPALFLVILATVAGTNVCANCSKGKEAL